jgi:hypothetical protein
MPTATPAMAGATNTYNNNQNKKNNREIQNQF